MKTLEDIDLEVALCSKLLLKVSMLSQLDVRHDALFSYRNGDFVGCQIHMSIDHDRDWEIFDFSTLQEGIEWCDKKLMGFKQYRELDK